MLGNTSFPTELLITGICCLLIVLNAALLTLSRNTCHLNLNQKLYSLKWVSCDSRHYMAKARAYSCQHHLWRVCINHAPAAPASVWTCTGHTGRTGRILYTCPYYTPSKGAIKLSQMLMKSMHRPHWLPQQMRIGHRTAQTSNTV